MTPRILFAGPLKDFSGYASASRNYVRALDLAGADVVTRDLRYDGGNYQRTPREEELSLKSPKGCNIFIQQTTPNEMEPHKDMFNVGAFCWETDKLSTQWVEQLNRMQLILVPSRENLLTAKRSGVVVPVELIPYSTDMARFSRPLESFQFKNLSDHFKFLSICQFSKKKGLDSLLKGYYSEFSQDDKVLLILKVYISPNDAQAEYDNMIGLINAARQACRVKSYAHIQLIHEVLSDESIDRLYKTADCYVLPSRGEGWGVPHFDALGFGMPSIGVKKTGNEEFITSSCGWLVDSHHSPVINMPHPHAHLYTSKENWREPNVGHLNECMREAYEKWMLRDESPAWNDMKKAAFLRAAEFSNEVIGPRLYNTILQYYNEWKS